MYDVYSVDSVESVGVFCLLSRTKLYSKISTPLVVFQTLSIIIGLLMLVINNIIHLQLVGA